MNQFQQQQPASNVFLNPTTNNQFTSVGASHNQYTNHNLTNSGNLNTNQYQKTSYFTPLHQDFTHASYSSPTNNTLSSDYSHYSNGSDGGNLSNKYNYSNENNIQYY
jgi:hypothetical protein